MIEIKPLDIRPDDGYVSYEQVMIAIVTRHTKVHGVLEAVVRNVAQRRADGEDVPPVTQALLTSWRLKKRYPAWMIDRINELTQDDVSGYSQTRWTQHEKQMLCELYREKTLHDHELAEKCSERFGRHVSQGQVKRQLMNLRLSGQIEPRSNRRRAHAVTRSETTGDRIAEQAN